MHSRRAFSKLSLAGIAVLAAAPATRALAQVGANLNISPRRIVFDAGARTSTALIFNTGAQPATYNIELIDRVMTPNGALTSLAEASKLPLAADAVARLKSAKSMVIFTPRRAMLGPGENQTIRLRVLRPGDLPDGEYRTHLTVTAAPPPDQGLTAEQAAAQVAGAITIRLTALFAISIPLIVRQGPPDVGAAIVGFSYRPPEAGGPVGGTLAVQIARTGTSSLYGDVEVRGARESRSAKPIGALGGVGVYPEIDRRTVEVPLSRPPARGETLEVVFNDDDVKPGRTLATGSFAVA